jgi:hypothetical protein
MDGTKRFNIRPGLRVSIILKKNQQTGKAKYKERFQTSWNDNLRYLAALLRGYSF